MNTLNPLSYLKEVDLSTEGNQAHLSILNQAIRTNSSVLHEDLINFYSGLLEDRPGDERIKLSNDQLDVLARVVSCIPFERKQAVNKDSKGEKKKKKEKYQQLLLLVHGGPGTGKSTLIDLISIYVRGLFGNEDRLSRIAPTGIAATLIDGVTLHSYLGINVKSTRKSKRIASKNDVSLKLQKELERKLNGINTIILDEVSMIPISLFLTLDRTLKAVLENDKPFGGVNIILFGDFFQITPVRADGLAKTLVDVSCRMHERKRLEHDKEKESAGKEIEMKSGKKKTNKKKKKTKQSISPLIPDESMNVANLFKQFKKFELQTQHRVTEAEDAQIEAINSFRRIDMLGEQVVTSRILDSIEDLDPTLDYGLPENQKWLIAPVVVATNRERHIINRERVLIYAESINQPVLSWKLPIKATKMADHNLLESCKHYIYQHNDDLFMYFVPLLPCVLSYNFDVPNGYANGTTVFLSDIDYSNLNILEKADIDKKRKNTENIGKVIELSEPPRRLFYFKANDIDHPLYHTGEERESRWNLCFDRSEQRDRFIDSMDKQSKSSISSSMIKINDHLEKEIEYTDYGIEVKLAITFHKIQGITALYLILLFNKSPDMVAGLALNFFSTYVAITRTRGFHCLRKVPLNPSDLRSLLSLKCPAWLRIYMRNYGPIQEDFKSWLEDENHMERLINQTEYFLNADQKRKNQINKEMHSIPYESYNQPMPPPPSSSSSSTKMALFPIEPIITKRLQKALIATQKPTKRVERQSITPLPDLDNTLIPSINPVELLSPKTVRKSPIIETIEESRNLPIQGPQLIEIRETAVEKEIDELSRDLRDRFWHKRFINDIDGSFIYNGINEEDSRKIDRLLVLYEKEREETKEDKQLTISDSQPLYLSDANRFRQGKWFNSGILWLVVQMMKKHYKDRINNNEFMVQGADYLDNLYGVESESVKNAAQRVYEHIRTRRNQQHAYTLNPNNYEHFYMICDAPSHFLLLRYERTSRTIYGLDSLDFFIYDPMVKKMTKALQLLIAKLLNCDKNQIKIKEQISTKQKNTYNCGVHTLLKLHNLIRNESVCYPENPIIDRFRKILFILFLCNNFKTTI